MKSSALASRQSSLKNVFITVIHAAELAWEAAELMPDNSDDTARVLCTGGTWLKNTRPAVGGYILQGARPALPENNHGRRS